ncbi:MAG: cation-translocating P-type ATPase [Candidatus Hodarchaeales archaeon]
MIKTESIVIRNNNKSIVFQEELVQGDIIEFESGQKIPADARVIESSNLQVIESSLTGESNPIEKFASITHDVKTNLAERSNMVYLGTTVSFGKGKAVITNIGKDTEVGKGKIVSLMGSIESSPTPLQKRLEIFGKQLGKGILVIASLMILFGFIVELLSSDGNLDVFQTFLDLTIIGVSLIVAAVPEGLPAVMVLVLALGIRRMAKRNTISKSLQAIEGLGAATFICTDKTGTLTQNKLVVDQYATFGEYFRHENLGNTTLGMEKLLKIAEVVNTATIKKNGEALGEIGDPLDIALLKGLEELDIRGIRKKNEWKKYSELPFDSSRKRMSSIIFNQHSSKHELLTKGAPDVLLDISNKIFQDDGSIIELNTENKLVLNKQIEILSKQGLKVLGFAYKEVSEEEAQITKSEQFKVSEIEEDLVFVGFIGLIDPPRPEVPSSISASKSAGIDIMMITGDHPNTALAIGKQIGLIKENVEEFLTGSDIDSLDGKELSDKLKTIRILARVSPEHKLRIVKLLQDQGHVVAMTGDGVNDSPALRQSDIGVAMGKTGTDAAAEAADIILTDDNFATLVSAIEEGRNIQGNIKNFIGYLLASNMGEVLLIVLGVLIVGLLSPTLIVELSPLSETQILYMNLVSDTFLAIALGLERSDSSKMDKPPINMKEPIINKKMLFSILYTGFYISLLTITVFFFLLGNPASWSQLNHLQIAYAQTMTMSLIVFMETVIALSYRSEKSIFSIGLFSNKAFLISFATVYLLHLLILYTPISGLFDLVPLSFFDWIVLIILASTALFMEEIRKKILMKYESKFSYKDKNKEISIPS